MRAAEQRLGGRRRRADVLRADHGDRPCVAIAAASVDVTVLEVGLGGRLDATNVVAARVAVVTGVAMDHEAILGDTLAAIAAREGGDLQARAARGDRRVRRARGGADARRGGARGLR